MTEVLILWYKALMSKLYISPHQTLFRRRRYFFANWQTGLWAFGGKKVQQQNTDKLVTRKVTRNSTTTAAIRIIIFAFTLPAESELLTQIRYCCVFVNNLDRIFFHIWCGPRSIEVLNLKHILTFYFTWLLLLFKVTYNWADEGWGSCLRT